MQNILKGHISQIVGPVVDVHFELGKDGEGLPDACDKAVPGRPKAL